MRFISLSLCVCILTFFFVLNAENGNAKPMQKKLNYRELLGESSDILDVDILAVYTYKEKPVGRRINVGTDVLRMQYVLECLVRRSHKGPIDEDVLVYVHYWRTYQVPSGYEGDTGQLMEAKAGDHAKVHCTRGKNERLELLVPNGLEVLRPIEHQGRDEL